MKKLTKREMEEMFEEIDKRGLQDDLQPVFRDAWESRENLRKRLEALSAFPKSKKGEDKWDVEDLLLVLVS